jgi:phospholipid/cholesterol/gamma-HCH transport system substrate-binding protein
MTSAAKVGFVMLLALAVLGYFILKIEDIDVGRSAGKRTVEVVFDDVAGLDEKSAVRIAGVRKGVVRGIKVMPDGKARVTLEIDDDVPLHSDASAKIANLGLLGEKYVEIDPGSQQAPVAAQGVIRLQGTQPSSFDDVTDQVSAIAEDVKAITSSLRQVMGTPTGQQRLDAIVMNVESITSQVRALIEANRSNVDATMANTREITAHLRNEIPRLANSIEAVANQIRGTVGENRSEVRELVTNLRTLSSDLRTTADNLNSITGQVKSGEGTVGKLLYSDEAHGRLTGALEAVQSGIGELKNTLGRVNRIGLDIGLKSDFYAGLSTTGRGDESIADEMSPDFGGNSRSAVTLRLRPNPETNRFYHLELSDDPRGRREDRVEVETVTDSAGAANTTVTRRTRWERDYLLSGQIGWRLEDFEVRVGLFDSTGGIGVDYDFNDRTRFIGEAFDFGGRRDANPHFRLYSEYTFRKEKKNTPRLFVTSGVDNVLNDTAFILGGGLRWRDDDLKYFMGSLPLGK